MSYSRQNLFDNIMENAGSEIYTCKGSFTFCIPAEEISNYLVFVFQKFVAVHKLKKNLSARKKCTHKNCTMSVLAPKALTPGHKVADRGKVQLPTQPKIFVKKNCVKIWKYIFSTTFGMIRPIAGGKLLAAANQRKAAQIDQWPEHISKCFVSDGGSANGIKVLLLLYNFISQGNKKAIKRFN